MFKVSCIQICSGKNIKKNLYSSKKLILKAIKQKSDFIITPENSSLFGLNKKELFKTATSMHKDFYLIEIRKLAKKYEKWILVGSAIIKENDKIKNRSILISPTGKRTVFRVKNFYPRKFNYYSKSSLGEVGLVNLL